MLLSYVFYAWGNPWWYVFLLFLTTIFDFYLGKKIEDGSHTQRKVYLIISVVANLGLLFVFKYTSFFVNNINHLIGIFYFQPIESPEISLPPGISFYTFQSLSYTIDIYRRQIKSTNNFITYGSFVSFFPHLVAGPILRAKDILPQLHIDYVKLNLENFKYGIVRIMYGLAKKIIFADALSVFVGDVFLNWETIPAYKLAFGVYAFAFQIYLDFSVYSDIAIGLARILNIHINENFNWPYLSKKNFRVLEKMAY